MPIIKNEEKRGKVESSKLSLQVTVLEVLCKTRQTSPRFRSSGPQARKRRGRPFVRAYIARLHTLIASRRGPRADAVGGRRDASATLEPLLRCAGRGCE